jgi:flagellum-specific ATP synthase
MRKQAAYLTLSIAEYLRDVGNDVLCLMDSVTRFAMAQREIGLAAGEPPTSRGYPPSVFNALPRLTERGGAIIGAGSISSIYSVLVEGDDMNEPIADHMRSLLDGHIVLTRDQANRGQWPAVDPLQSVSRWVGRLMSREEREVATEVQRLFATYEASRDLIDMGAWQRGANTTLDRAVQQVPDLQALFRQAPTDSYSRDDGYARLSAVLAGGEVA